MSAGAPGPVERLSAFFGARIWEARLADLPAWKGALFWVARIADTMLRGFLDTRLSFRAAALTYFTVLSVVPFLAFAFAVLKGFGVYRTFVQGTIRPYVDQTFAGNQALYDAIDHILRFVDQTDVSKLGTLGVVALAYAAVTLVANVEVALNAIFGAKTRRPIVRQVTDYVTLLVTAPLLLLSATTLSTAAQSSALVEFLRERLGLGPIIDFGLGLGSTATVAAALFAMFVILPNVRVRVRSALLGAGIAALLWHGALVLHVQLQMGVARYSALYSVLGAIPIFLVWTYVSWLVVLVGARIAAGHQDVTGRRRALRAPVADEALKEELAVALAAEVTRGLVAGTRPGTVDDLARRLEVPPSLAEEVLDALVRAGVLARVVSGGAAGFLPARDVDRVRAEDVRDALRREPAAEAYRARVRHRLDPGLQRVLRAEEERRRGAPENLTLRELAAAASEAAGREEEPPAGEGEAAGATPEDGRDGGRDRRPVLDEKQPDA